MFAQAVRVFILAMTLLAVAGCQATKPLGAAASIDEARRVTLLDAPDLLVYVTEVDGVHRGLGAKAYQLTPGIHTITVTVMISGPVVTRSGTVYLKHHFEEGKTYSVQSRLEPETCRVWIIDEQTKAELEPLPLDGIPYR